MYIEITTCLRAVRSVTLLLGIGERKDPRSNFRRNVKKFLKSCKGNKGVNFVYKCQSHALLSQKLLLICLFIFYHLRMQKSVLILVFINTKFSKRMDVTHDMRVVSTHNLTKKNCRNTSECTFSLNQTRKFFGLKIAFLLLEETIIYLLYIFIWEVLFKYWRRCC